MANFGTGFTSISDYLSANRGTLDRERDELAQGAGAGLDSAKAADDAVIAGVKPGSDYSSEPGYYDALKGEQTAAQGAGELASSGGVADLLQQHYASKDPTYTQGKAGFDASLVGRPEAFGELAGRGQTLTGYLQQGAAGAAAQTPPPPEPAGPHHHHPDPHTWRQPGGGPATYHDPWAQQGENAGLGPWTPGVILGSALFGTSNELNSHGAPRGGKGVMFGPDGQPLGPDGEELSSSRTTARSLQDYLEGR